MKGRIIAAIAASVVEFAHCKQAEYPLPNIIVTLLCFITFGYVFMAFVFKDEVANIIKDRKRSKSRPVNIVFHDCEKERRIREFQAERQRFFDEYFRSSIEVTKNKSKI